ncbi:MAG TPA: NUDIX hydrolase [Granulicella sp.]
MSARLSKTSSPASKSASKAKSPAKSTSKSQPSGNPFKRPSASLKAKLIDSQLVYTGRTFRVFNDTVIEPGGHQNQRDVIRHNGSVVILGVDDSKSKRDPEVVLIRQYRHAAGRFLIELPAGRLEPGEKPLAAAKREMAEETGYTARRWTLLTKYYASPGFLGEWMQIYLARDIREGIATPEEDEHIEIQRVRLSEAMKLVATNEIVDGKTLIGLSLYAAALREGRL